MRCLQCNYPLWGIAERTCPECGAPFKPSELDFEQNTVCFHCPHCRQVYYGNDRRGHLEPSSFNCVNCHQHITMDDMILEPADGNYTNTSSESKYVLNVVPWLQIDDMSLTRRFIRTVLLGVDGQNKLASALAKNPSGRGVGSFLGYFSGVYIALAVFFLMLDFMFPGFGVVTQYSTANMMASLSVAALWIAILPAILIMLVVCAAAAHVTISRKAPNRLPFDATVAAFAYTIGPTLALNIPFLAAVAGLPAILLWFASATIVLATLHQVPHKTALLGTSIVPLLMITAFIFLIILAGL